eukprot:gene7262-9796_t
MLIADGVVHVLLNPIELVGRLGLDVDDLNRVRAGAVPRGPGSGRRRKRNANGTRGGDELNIPLAGKDYGWPTVTYGVEYSGRPIGEGITAKAGTEQPVYYWDPVIAPSG